MAVRGWMGLAALLALSLGATAQEAPAPAPARTITMSEAVEVALRQAPALRAGALSVEAARQRVALARAAWWPSLVGTASYSRQTGNQAPRPGYDPGKLFGGNLPSASNQSYNYFNFGVGLTQNLDLGRTINAADAVEAAADAAGDDLRAARRAAWLGVVQRYFAVLASQELVGVADRARVQARRHADSARAMFAAGTRPRIDYVRAEADAQNAEVGLLTARDSLVVSKASLLAAMGERQRQDFAVVPPPDAPAAPPVGDLDAAFDEALAARPEREALLSRIASQEAVVRSLWQQYFPSLAVTASATESGLEVTNLVGNWAAGATLTLPLLSAVATVPQVREAETARSILQANLENLELQVRLDVEQAAARLNDATAKIAPTRAALEATREGQALAVGRYEAGAGNYVELLDAQAAFANAEANMVRARYDLAVARAAWDAALGRVPDAAR